MGRWTPWVLAAVPALLVAGFASPSPPAGAAGGVTVRVLQAVRTIAGPAPVFRWPAVGEAAVAVGGTGIVGETRDQRPVPIASVTKMMTAIVVLHDHPLAPGQAGPAVEITAGDVEDWRQELAAGDSVLAVDVGERLTEYQLLEALLIPSADNVADLLAAWDAGSSDRFVARMNRTAESLALTSTHYADPSGVDPRSVSDAADQALVAARLMADPVVRGIVRRARISLPIAGIIPNRNPALAIGGIVGVKGGYTSHAGYCLVTAAFRMRHASLVISVALGQPDEESPASIDEELLRVATPALRRARLTAPGARVGTATLTPGPVFPLFGPSTPPTAVVWPGLVVRYAISVPSAQALRAATPQAAAGTLTISAPWGSLAEVAVTAGPPG